jgi:hypothetical protein
MKVALGLKAHSGWAALVVLGSRRGKLEVVERRRVELVAKDEAAWAKQPYHAAQHLEPAAARDLVQRGIATTRRSAIQELRAVEQRVLDVGHEIAGCGVLTVDPMPDWTVAEILAVHFRMHKAEGVLFRDALVHASGECGLKCVEILEKQLDERARRVLATSLSSLRTTLASLGKSVGPPWGKDQKDASLAAMIALRR